LGGENVEKNVKELRIMSKNFVNMSDRSIMEEITL